jgi:hypothetical protein
MDPFGELIAVNHRQALEFFTVRLQDISEPDVDREELLYNASVLAHYAQTSDTTLIHDSLMMETAGAQCLLLAGFFEAQMSARHNIRWYAELGAGFFGRAASGESSPNKARLLNALSKRFEPWRRRHAQVSRELRDLPYILDLPNRSQ